MTVKKGWFCLSCYEPRSEKQMEESSIVDIPLCKVCGEIVNVNGSQLTSQQLFQWLHSVDGEIRKTWTRDRSGKAKKGAGIPVKRAWVVYLPQQSVMQGSPADTPEEAVQNAFDDLHDMIKAGSDVGIAL